MTEVLLQKQHFLERNYWNSYQYETNAQVVFWFHGEKSKMTIRERH